MKDGPPPGCVILLLFAVVVLLACGLLVSLVDRLTPQVAAGPVYQYAVCGSDQLRAYDGADGYVRAGRWVYVDPPLAAGRTPRCPTSARRGYCRSSAAACRCATRRACSCSPGTARGACRRWARNCSRRWCAADRSTITAPDNPHTARPRGRHPSKR